MADDPLVGVKADLTATSNQISSQVRTIVLGVLAFVWLFLSGAKDMPASIVEAMRKDHLILIAIFAIASLVIDLLQYLCGYWSGLKVLKNFDPARPDSAGYDDSWIFYRARKWSFWLKQLLAVAGVVWLLVLLMRAVVA